MEQRYIQAITMILIVLIYKHRVKASVIVKLDSQPAFFGQNVTLTCYTQQLLKNSKDCPVRQWTIGDNTAVLVYNSFSYETDKYADNTNLSSDHFSIVIKKFSFSDVGKKYTCSCGFHSASMFLSLDGYPIVHKPDNSSVEFYIQNDTVLSNLDFLNVFPVPHCSLVMKDQVTNNVSSTVEGRGLLYDVSMAFIYNLTRTDCNRVLHPTVECYFREGYTMQFKRTFDYQCLDITDPEVLPRGTFNPSTAKMDLKREQPISTTTVGTAVGIISFIAVGAGALLLKYFCKKKPIHKPSTDNKPLRAISVERGDKQTQSQILHENLLPPPRWCAGDSTDGRGSA